MKSILEGDRKEANKTRRVDLKEQDEVLQTVLSSHKTIIKIVGVGGAGNNTLSRLMEVGVKEVVTIAVNTDAQDLLYTTATNKILIGRDITNGLGAGSNPQIGENSARENENDIKEILDGSDMVFVTCGLGGGTGTGAAPVVAEIARNSGALTISIVTLPFTEEGTLRWDNAKAGLKKLRQNSDTVIAIQNDKLLEIAPDFPLDAAFKIADEILVNAVKGITELITEKGMVNLDFADIKAIMHEGGTAMIGIGESESENRALDAMEAAIKNPLLEVDIVGAKSALLNITGGKSMSLKDTKIIMKMLSERLDPSARVIWGAKMDESMNETIRVMLIVTGLKSSKQIEQFSGTLEEDSLFTEKLIQIEADFENETVDQQPIDRSLSNIKDSHSTESKKRVADKEFSEKEISDEILYSENLDKEDNFSNSVKENHTEIHVEAIKDDIDNEFDKIEGDFQKKEIFDIKEIEHVDKSQPSKKPVKKAERKSKKVFTEIFEEEAKGDLNILQKAVGLLNSNKADKKVFKDIKNSCSSLRNIAQLYTFEQIESFATSIYCFIDFLLSQEAIPVQSVQKALAEVPDTINDLIYEDEAGLKKVSNIQSKFQGIREATEKRNPK